MSGKWEPPGECKFELIPLHCHSCGAYIGEVGTCEDIASCKKCIQLSGEKVDNILQPAYEKDGSAAGRLERIRVRK